MIYNIINYINYKEDNKKQSKALIVLLKLNQNNFLPCLTKELLFTNF